SSLPPRRTFFFFTNKMSFPPPQHIVFARHFAATTLLPLRKNSFHPPPFGGQLSLYSTARRRPLHARCPRCTAPPRLRQRFVLRILAIYRISRGCVPLFVRDCARRARPWQKPLEYDT